MPVLWLALRRATTLRSTARAGYFAAVEALFDSPRVRIEPSGFPRLAGTWQGASFDLQAVPDTLTYRKLPSLWVMVTLTAPQPVTGEMHIMSRPGQNDTFSRFDQMPVSVALPAGFPEYCALRCDSVATLPPEAVVAAQAALFANPLVKELVISPKGLRLVMLAEEADRGRYLLFRDGEMGRVPLAAARLMPQLVALTSLQSALKEASHG